ncbi:hypothetical protein [Paenibacillus flagellatus]|uniref:Uncharacterized protein n=1 Tax=Paenibacillus flagellatus TaxID=2211139 RepID=A0A2V5K7S5_9BACL|nr:hypothetical protein [Paenibacillus flagellatus]PYI53873.1 hypothetical protein DLM86_15060 [Paenibacillus flagellatus]
MKLVYRFDPSVVDIEERRNGADAEFTIRILREDLHADAIKRAGKHFEENRVHTDVLIYAYPNREYKAIVRPDYYVDFVLELMKRKLLTRVEWTAD